MYVYVCAYIYVCVCVYMRSNTCHSFVRYIYTYMYVCMYMYEYTYVCMFQIFPHKNMVNAMQSQEASMIVHEDFGGC